MSDRPALGELRLLQVLGVAGSLIAILDPAVAATEAQRTSVVSVRAGQTCLREEVRITGFVVARDERGASIPAPGYRIAEIFVNEGDRVAEGQDLLRATRQDDSVRGAPASAKSDQPATLTLHSPVEGTITHIAAKIGTLTGSARPIPGAPPPEPQIRVAASVGLDLLVDVPSIYATQIRKGSLARILREGDTDSTGTVRVPVSEINPASQLGQARVSIEPPSTLWPGEFASAIIETAHDCGVAVPRAAVTYQNGSASVQVLNGTSVETRSVRVGLSDSNNVQIREGLAEGEPVVASVGTALKPGDRVTPVLQGEPGAATP